MPHTSPRSFVPFFGLLSCLALADSASAQLPVTQLFALSPPGGKQASTVDVAISSGTDLDGVKALYFSHPGITAVQKMSPPKLPQLAAEPIANQFTVTIPADVPPGVYDVRAIGTFGVSNPRSFVVGTLPEVKEQSGNNVREKAQAIELNTTVNSTADGNNSDWYRFAGKAGQRLIVDCWAQRIDSRMDATMELYDAAGKQLARSRDFNRRDPLIDFSVPADGDYFLKLFDFVYGGGGEHFYRFAVSTGPYVDYLLPPCGLPGTKGTFTLYGRNLPGGVPADGLAIEGRPLEKLAVEMDVPGDKPTERVPPGTLAKPDEAELDGFEYRFVSPQGTSNACFIGYAAAPVVLEQEPNDEPAKANVVTLPCEFVGEFGPRGNPDWLQFEAKAGEVYWLEAISERLGLPTDPAVLIQRVTKNDKGEEQAADITDFDDHGANVGGLSFNTTSDDGSFRFAVPAEGTYRAMIRDLALNPRNDPRRIYRLSIHREQPDFRLAAVPIFPANNKTEARPWNPLLRRGSTERIDVVAFRRDGFAGEMKLAAEGLPAGVTAAPAIIGQGQNATTLTLTASDQAADWTGPIQIVGRAKVGATDVARAARPGTVLYAAPQNIPAHARLARSMVLAVTAADTAPLTVELGEGKTWEMSRAGKLEIPVKVTRRGTIKGNITLTAQGMPPNVQPQPLTLDGNTNEGKLALQINPQAPLGEFSLYLQAQTTASYRRDVAAAEAAAKTKAEIEKLAADLAAASQVAETAKQAAVKAAAEADAALKAAQVVKQQATAETQEAADKALAEAEAKLKAANDARAAAEKAADDAAALAKAAAELKPAADKRAADTANAAAPKDVALFWPSTSTAIKITAAPITMTATAPAAAIKLGAQGEVPVKIERLYGFGEAVQVQAVLPGGVQGVTIAPLPVPAGQAEVKLIVQAAANATPGTHAITIKAIAPFNGQQLAVEQPVMVLIEK
ncbi:MAG TPA: PPC domain-containing protein [Pirellulales bacterium]|nr:PPC domain-containing protein [Pirellulales bacterium]